MKSFPAKVLPLALVFSFVQIARADYVQIPLPDSTYTSSTNLLTPTVEDVPITSLSNGSFTVSFSGADVIPRAPVPDGWATWADVPYTEGAHPRVLEVQTPLECVLCTLTMDFSSPTKIFGFEAQTDPFPNAHDLLVTYYDGSDVVGTTTMHYDSGIASARLIASLTTDMEFTRVGITSDTDFGIANLRYDAGGQVPEPASSLLIAIGFCTSAAFLKTRLRAKNHADR
jgi:hypothetical protein